MTKQELLFDLDDVICDFNGSFTIYASLCLGRELQLPTQWDYTASWDLAPSQVSELMNNFITSPYFGQCPPVEDALEGLSVLCALGASFSIVTARGTTAPPPLRNLIFTTTETWLRKHEVPYNFVFFERNKGLQRGFALIDDGTHNLEAATASPTIRHAICFNQPWNQDWQGPRAHTWPELIDLIQDLGD